jgi:hypothetical protein
MRKFRTARPSSCAARGLAPSALVVLVACAAWLLAAGAASAQTPAPRRDDADAAARQARMPTPTVEDEDDEGESADAADTASRTRPAVTDPAAVLRTARLVYVSSDTAFVNAREVEASLLKRKEFRAWGMSVTRNAADADLIIEITRQTLTRRFTFTVVDPRTMAVVTSGKTRSVLFGKKIPNKIAEKFTNRVRVVRPYPPVAARP